MNFDRTGRAIETLNGSVATYFEDEQVLDLGAKITAESLKAILSSGAVDDTRRLQCLQLKTLDTLTDEITRLKKLVKVDFQAAGRLVIEPSFWTLETLEDARIAAVSNKNDLSGFRPLPNLRTLYLSAFKLAAIPPAIGGCSQLQSLELDYLNWLTVLPEEIAGLEKLEKLKISGGRFQKLPNGVGRLPALRELRIYAPIKALPDLSGLKSLRVLELYETNLKELPESISQLEALEEMTIVAPEVTRLPDLRPLKALKTLRLFGLRSVRPSAELAEHPSLERIECSRDQVAELDPQDRAAFGNRLVATD